MNEKGIGTILYRKEDGEIVGWQDETPGNVSVQASIDMHIEALTNTVTLEDADGGEYEAEINVNIAGIGELLQETTLDESLDRLFVALTETKDEAYLHPVTDVNIEWHTTTVNINGEDKDVKHNPIINEKTVVSDENGIPTAIPKQRPQVSEDDADFDYIDTRMHLISAEEWGDHDGLSSFLEDKKIDHANRRIIDKPSE